MCRECCRRWPDDVVRPIEVGEIPNPPDVVDILFVGVAPTAEDGPDAGGHFYSSPGDRLRRGLFALLSEPEFGLSLTGLGFRESTEDFHRAGCFFVHSAKVRPRTSAAPPKAAIESCARHHLQEEICLILPRAVCFLGKNNASVVAFALFGHKIGFEPETVRLEQWAGVAVVAPQPIRGRMPVTREVLAKLWRGRSLRS